MNQPSHYQSAFFSELARRSGVSLHVIYAAGMDAERRALGWRTVFAKGYTEEVLLADDQIGRLLRLGWQERRSVHLINGVWAVRPFVFAAIVLAVLGARRFFHSEAPNPAQERKGLVRWLKRTFGRVLVNGSDGLFAIGEKSANYYRGLGVREDRLFKFAYFLGPSEAVARKKRDDADAFRVLYVGQYIERKGVSCLLAAVARLRSTGIAATVRLIGSGPLENRYRREAADLGIASAVLVDCPLPPEAARRAMEMADVLVLPSDFDGWGLTVNEALQGGCPVLVSAECGVAELIRHRPEWGRIVPARAPAAWAAALREMAIDPATAKVDPAEVEALIGCRAMTDHFLACVHWAMGRSSKKPSPSWDAANSPDTALN